MKESDCITILLKIKKARINQIKNIIKRLSDKMGENVDKYFLFTHISNLRIEEELLGTEIDTLEELIEKLKKTYEE